MLIEEWLDAVRWNRSDGSSDEKILMLEGRLQLPEADAMKVRAAYGRSLHETSAWM